MDKRGVIVIQFNWIYILIVGGLILAMFIGMIVRQRDISETAASNELQRTLQTILITASTKAKRADVIDLPNVEIDYDRFGYTIGSLNPFTPGISFSPSKIKVRGRQLILWTLDWNVPYRIANFLYLTSTQVRYVLVGSGDLLYGLRKIFPETINIEYNPQPSSFIDKNNYKVKFVFVNSDPASYQQLVSTITKGEVNIVEISGDGYSGEVKFYDSSLRETGNSYYLGVPSLIAAMFTDDVEAYNVNMDKAYKKLSIITEIYMDKVSKLAEHYADDTTLCYGRYDIVILQSLKNTASTKPIQQGEIDTINSAIYDLDEKNYELQVNSCPMIY